MTALYEQLANSSSTTLNGAINGTVTTVVVTDGSVFPSTGNFRVLVGNEIMLVTARAGNSLTVIRGSESTFKQTHATSVVIKMILTDGSFKRSGSDVVPHQGNQSTLHGQLNHLVDSSGNLLTASNFTWQNQAGSSTTDLANGNIQVDFALTTGTNIRSFYRTAPTAPYSIQINFAPVIYTNGVSHCGMVFRESATGELIIFGITGQKELLVQRFNSDASFNSTQFGLTDWYTTGTPWMRLEDDNTDLNFYYSPNGILWQLVHSEGRTAFMAGGPDQVGVYGQAANTTTLLGLILTHWSGE